MRKPIDPYRRRFLRAAAAGGTLYALGRTPGMTWAQVAGTGGFTDYKALVCVFLFGGNDSWNMVVPRSDAEYNAYAASRQNLAVPQADLLPINPLVPDGAQYGFNPAMPELAQLFESARCAVVPNVGPLIRSVDKAAFLGGTAVLPPQLFSHNDQQDQWHSLRGAAVTKTGWAGRIADLLASQVGPQQLATNISLSGQVLFQAGDQAVPYTMGPAGAQTFGAFSPDDLGLARRAAFEAILNANHGTVYERGYAAVQRRAIQFAQVVNDALAASTLATPFPKASSNRTLASLATQLETVAKMISQRDRLQMTRQVFFVSIGGFDTHDNQLTDQPNLYAGISGALKAFYDATVELGVADRVTTFTQSDFGRTLTSNGDGSDHAWGGVQLVMGDAVRGRTFYGAYPTLQIDGPDDVGGGRMIPTVSADQYAATLAKWFGVNDTNLAFVAPSLANFTTRDLGFLV